MKLYLLIFAVLLPFSGFAQKTKPVTFSITDEALIHNIVESPLMAKGIADDGTGDDGPVVYMIQESLEFYHISFLRSVNRLRKAVVLKNDLRGLQEYYPEFRNDKEAWKLLIDSYYESAYASVNYKGLYQEVKKNYAVFKKAAQNPKFQVFIAFDEDLEYTASYRKELLDSAETIMRNLSDRKNAASNRKSAKEGRGYFAAITSKRK